MLDVDGREITQISMDSADGFMNPLLKLKGL
jgi:hypothetical protein